MKKLLLFALALSMAFCLCACVFNFYEMPAPTAEPAETQAPSVTEEPAETDEPGPGRTPEEYVGTWQYEGRSDYIVIHDDWLWALYDENLTCVMTGSCRLEEGYGLVLETSEGGDYDYFQPNGDGTLYNSAFDTVLPAEMPEALEGEGTTPEAFAGPWYSKDDGIYLYIYNDMTWATYDETITYLEGGVCRFDDDYGFVLEYYSGTDYDFLRYNDEGILYNSCYSVYERCADFLFGD